MTQYRILERLNDLQEWEPAGVAYMQGERCLLYLGSPGPMFTLPVHLSALDEIHLPVEGKTKYRWAKYIESWEQHGPFDPDAVLSSTLESVPAIEDGIIYISLEQVPPEYRNAVIAIIEDDFQIQSQHQYINRVMRDFVASYINDRPPPPEFVEVLWRYWAYETKRPPLPYAEHNVALLLYARAFGFPVEDYPQQINYLNNHKSLYASLASTHTQWGARASLSKEIGAALDAPVMNVWILKNQGYTERVIITGKGLPQYQEKIYSDALVTAMRVQASNLDLANVGLMDIRWTEQTESLDIQLPVLGDNAPLADRETAEDALGELIKQLRDLSDNTGFVQIHETDANITKLLEETYFKKLAQDAINKKTPVLWAPDSEMMNASEELVAVVPVYTLKRRGTSRKARASHLTLDLPLQLLSTKAWKKFYDAYSEHLIRRIKLDARIRLDFYNRRANSLRAKKELWENTPDELMRQQIWGSTVTLNQQFDDATGLTIWLQPPEIKLTEEFYEENVPSLIHGYELWATKMQNILDSLFEATERPDAPFRRFITTRLFDAVLRERNIDFSIPKIQKLYLQWSAPVADLLCFLWRKKLRPLGKPKDLFSPHTTFQTAFVTNDEETALNELRMVPYVFFDAKRSVVLLDPERGFMIIKNAADYPMEATPKPDTENILDTVRQHGLQDESNLAEMLRQKLIDNPQKASEQFLEVLRPQVPDEPLIRDSNRVRNLKATGHENAKFPRLIYFAESAMNNRALLTARQALEEAQTAIPNLLKKWQGIIDEGNEENLQHSLRTLPRRNEIECRLYLLMAIAECLATDHLVKDILPSIYRTPQTGKRAEIYEALAAADNADPDYTSEWIEALSQWDLNIVYNKLIRDLPGEEHLSSVEEHSATRLFEAIELVHIAGELRKATAALSHIQETRASALVKLVPAMEHAILSNAAGIVRGDLEYLLELLTGRQVGFGRDRS